MTFKKNIFKISAILLILFAAAILLYPTISQHIPFDLFKNNPIESNPHELSKLTDICDEMTNYILSSDGITCNFSVKNPGAYLPGKRPDTLGSFSYSPTAPENIFLENTLYKLSDIRKSSLSAKDKLTYNLLYDSISLSLNLSKYPLYAEPLSPISGIHTQLPILLGEFHFYDESYIETYFNILHSVPAYFSQIIEFEKNKAANNMFMDTTLADKVIAQCREFIASPIKNHLIVVFDEKTKDFKHFNNYSIANKNIVLNEIIPAYESLISEIEALKDYCTPAFGLCQKKPKDADTDYDGKSYYTYLFRQQTCSNLNPDKAYALIEKTLKNCKKNIEKITSSYTPSNTDTTSSPNIQSELPSEFRLISQTAYNIIATLKQKMLTSYPALTLDTNLEIKQVPGSLENSLSPAMYLTPPIDDFENDCIYINSSSCDPESLYTTIAHETFPGHMYQIRYFHSLNPNPVRLLLNMSGYAEGWATYTELDMMDTLGTDSQLSEILKNNKLALLCIYSMIDIGIHYYGWELFDCIEFLMENGFDDTDAAKEIYNDIAYEPVTYSKYTLGCIEFINMKKYVMKKEGDKFDEVNFHKLILETGPVWFDDLWKIIKKRY